MISNDEFMVILGRQWIQPQVKDFLFTGFLRDLAMKHGNLMGCSWEYNGNAIEWKRNGTNEQGYDLGLPRKCVCVPAQPPL